MEGTFLSFPFQTGWSSGKFLPLTTAKRVFIKLVKPTSYIILFLIYFSFLAVSSFPAIESTMSCTLAYVISFSWTGFEQNT